MKADGCKIMDMDILNENIQENVMCRKCKNAKSKMALSEDMHHRKGLAAKLVLKCTNCNNEAHFYTSKKVSENKNATNKPFSVNVRSVYVSQSLGNAGLRRFCANMDLPPPIGPKPYNNILKNLCEESVKLADELMCQSGKRLFVIILTEEPDNIEMANNGQMLANVPVTVDGTWQRRGHCSKIGIVFIISVHTGEVLDYIIKSLVCHSCINHNHDDKQSKEYKDWFEKHKINCLINHSGSSDSMESDGACEIFIRSIERFSLKYNTFVGDGDTGCYGKVRDRCYGIFGESYKVIKEECVGHVQKRMGSGLREFKRKHRGMELSDNKVVGGKGRLTDQVIDKIQNYYGEAIRNNAENIELMETAIWAIFHHMIRNDEIELDKQHGLCQKGGSSWCTYWRNPNEYNDNKRLPSAFIEALKPLFKNLTKEERLKRCLLGLTHNQNEAINGVLWSKCPTTKFCGVRKVQLAVSETVMHFNSGAASRAVTLKNLGVAISSTMLTALRKEDTIRINIAAKKIIE